MISTALNEAVEGVWVNRTQSALSSRGREVHRLLLQHNVPKAMGTLFCLMKKVLSVRTKRQGSPVAEERLKAALKSPWLSFILGDELDFPKGMVEKESEKVMLDLYCPIR